MQGNVIAQAVRNLVPSIPLCWWLLLVSMAVKHNKVLLNLITGTKNYIFRTVLLSIIRSLFTVHSALVNVIQVCRQLPSRSICHMLLLGSFRAVPSWSCSKALYKPLWYIPMLRVHWINSWWWTDELSEICRISWQNKFLKLVHLVGFITKKLVTMYGHMKVKKYIVSA